MTLLEAYKKVFTTLPAQAQGTCGIYSFYAAVQLLRQINPGNPATPAPKKSKTRETDIPDTSLRAYARREFKSGQGEILSESEMSSLIVAHGYKANAFNRLGDSGEKAKATFISDHLKKNHPVLIAYMAIPDTSQMKYTLTPTNGANAHWSLIIGATIEKFCVIEPNKPSALPLWPKIELLRSNGKSDVVKFQRYWAKTVYDEKEQLRQSTSVEEKKDKKKEHLERGIEAIGSSLVNWSPNRRQRELPNKKETENIFQTKHYDLGGEKGDRVEKQDLNHVLIAVISPKE